MANSTISWLDFSEAERRKMIEVVSLFKEQDTRDELGVASIRDNFADLFFPGTSTLQTRARYFLFVPWLYRNYEKKHIPTSRISGQLRSEEISLINTLIRCGETDGVIGQRSRSNLHRFPSNIYWIGMQTWGICHFRGTQDQYHRSLDRWYEKQKNYSDSPDHSPEERPPFNWDLELPTKPDEFPTSANFKLTEEEAEFLRERILISCPESMLAHILHLGQPIDDIVQYPWFHPQVMEFPNQLKNWLAHAQNFSEALHGAALLYNLMLAEKAINDERLETYKEDLKKWTSEIASRKGVFVHWDRLEFWSIATRAAHVYLGTHRFVDSWLQLLLDRGRISNPVTDKQMRSLVESRELQLKGGRARLGNQRHLELWSGASSVGQIGYRWSIARRISNDILTSLKGNKRGKNARSR
jgi:hypothetical protein